MDGKEMKIVFPLSPFLSLSLSLSLSLFLSLSPLSCADLFSLASGAEKHELKRRIFFLYLYDEEKSLSVLSIFFKRAIILSPLNGIRNTCVCLHGACFKTHLIFFSLIWTFLCRRSHFRRDKGHLYERTRLYCILYQIKGVRCYIRVGLSSSITLPRKKLVNSKFLPRSDWKPRTWGAFWEHFVGCGKWETMWTGS